MLRYRLSLSLFVLISCAGISCTDDVNTEPALSRYAFAAPAMGTQFRILLYSADSTAADRAAAEAFALADSLEVIMSDYRPRSELNRLSATAGSGRDIVVSDLLMQILLESRRISELTGGAFDVSAGALTRLWRRGIRRGEVPPDTAIARALTTVGYAGIIADSAAGTVRLVPSGMRLDLGGIAKGFAADRMLDLLRSKGIPSAMVDAGGDLAVGDPPPGSSGWRIVLDRAGGPDNAVALLVTDLGVATSGDLYRYIESDGRRYSHILDPATGYGTSHTRSVTVIAPTATLADALASAFSVLPAPDAIRLAESQQNVEARILLPQDASETPLVVKSSEWPGDPPDGTASDSSTDSAPGPLPDS